MAAGTAILVNESTDVVSEVKKLADAGSDWIKAFICEVNKLKYPMQVPRISGKQIKLIIDTAHEKGKPCMVHVDNIRHMHEAVDAGADSIEHVFANGATETEIDDDLIDKLIKKQTYIVPTIYAIKAHENPNGNMPLVFDMLISEVGKLVRAGVKIGLGTDSSIPFVTIGESMHEELAMLVKCGMTPADAIAAATYVNARLLRMEKELGSVSPGFLADLVVLDGDPLSDINQTRKISLVISNGRIVTDNT